MFAVKQLIIEGKLTSSHSWTCIVSIDVRSCYHWLYANIGPKQNRISIGYCPVTHLKPKSVIEIVNTSLETVLVLQMYRQVSNIRRTLVGN